jgi:O-antigen/teichoic acid export membrane protein
LGPGLSPPVTGLARQTSGERVSETSTPAAVDDRLRGITDLRRHIARGMLTNGAFDVGMVGLTALRGLTVAAFVSRSDYGVWGLVGLTMWTAVGLKTTAGAGEKYIQQSDANQERAFQSALTAELIFTCAAIPIAVAMIAAVTLATGKTAVLAPALILLAVFPATILQFPIATFYRRMEFRRQRTLQAIDPVLGALVTIPLAVAGAGYWSFVIGMLAGAWATALATVRASPYRLALRYEPGTVRQYVAFSAPLLVTAVAVLVLFNAIYLVGSHAIGLAGLGAFTLAGNFVQFTDQADNVVTGTLYPAVCAVKDRVRLLSEIFVKSNRLSLIWAVPFGSGIALFASDLVRFVLGSRWLPAVPLLEIMGIVTAVHHVGYNWAAFVKARGTTWPIAVSAVLVTAAVVGTAVPLMYTVGLVGLGIAFAIGEVVAFGVRAVWLARFFTNVRIFSQLLRGFAPTMLAAAPILVGRALFGIEQSLPAAVALFVLYVAITVAATVAFERPLLKEAVGALMRRSLQPA